MNRPDPVSGTVAEAQAVAKGNAVAPAQAGVRVELDGNEIIELSIKPSWWFIPMVSLKWVLTATLLGALLAIVARGRVSAQVLLAFQVLATIAVLRVGFGALQWASRLYVLTNRRVMRFRGVLNVEVAECPLTRIAGVDLRVLGHQRLLRLGSVVMTPADSNAAPIVWDDLAHPHEVHERLVRAVRRAQGSG